MNVSGTELTTNLPRPYGFLIFARAALAFIGLTPRRFAAS